MQDRSHHRYEHLNLSLRVMPYQWVRNLFSLFFVNSNSKSGTGAYAISASSCYKGKASCESSTIGLGRRPPVTLLKRL